MLKVKERKKIYLKWQSLQKELKDLSSLVKDDTDMTYAYFNIWLKKWMQFKTDLKETYKETLQHVENS